MLEQSGNQGFSVLSRYGQQFFIKVKFPSWHWPVPSSGRAKANWCTNRPDFCKVLVTTQYLFMNFYFLNVKVFVNRTLKSKLYTRLSSKNMIKHDEQFTRIFTCNLSQNTLQMRVI